MALDEITEQGESLIEIFSKENLKLEKRRFGSKLGVISDLRFALLHANHFLDDLERIRNKHKIPLLDPSQDIQLFTYKGIPDLKSPSRSLFWEAQGLKKESQFDSGIRKLIDSYEHVPSYLFGWIKYVAMYQIEIGWVPENDVDLFLNILKNPKDIEKLPLNTQEKETFLNTASKLLEMKIGRPHKEQERMFSAIREHLSLGGKSKLSKMYAKGKTLEIFHARNQGKSYDQLVREIYKESDEDASWMNHDRRVRHAMNIDKRFRKRLEELTRKKEKY